MSEKNNNLVQNPETANPIVNGTSPLPETKKVRKPVLGKAPYFRTTDESKNSTTKMMVDVLIALILIILFAWYKNGLKPYITLNNISITIMLWPLLFVVVGALTSMVLEGLYFSLFKGVRGFKNLVKTVWESYAIIPGVLLALILPIYTPIWILMLGCLISNIVFKMLFGGFGHNLFNPALIGYVFIMAAFAGVIGNSYMSPSDSFQSIASVTPLATYSGNLGASYETLVGNYGNLWNFLIGTVPGSLGETSALLCILAFVYLVIRRTINWYVPTIYVGTVFVLTWIIGAINGQPGIWYPLFNILSGGLMFGAVFMATEPVTAPKTPNGKVIFAIFIGIFTVLFRCIGSMNEGVATAILFMCLFSSIIDGFCAKLRANPLKGKSVLKYGFVVVLMLAIAGYTLYKSTPIKAQNDENKQEEVVDDILSVESVSQSFDKIPNFNSVVKKGDKTYNLELTYSENKFTVVNGLDDLTNDDVTKLQVKLKAKLPTVYFSSANTEKVVVLSKGYSGYLTIEFTISANKVTNIAVTKNNESYNEPYNQGYNASNGDPINDLPGALVNAGDDFSGVHSIAGATITSNAIKSAYQLVLDYLASKGGN